MTLFPVGRPMGPPYVLSAQLRSQELADHVDGEQIADPLHARVLSELVDVGVRHTGPQFGDPVVGDLAIGDEARVRRGDVLGEQLAAGDLDVKVLLERNTMSRKSIDSAPRSPISVASGVTSSSSTPSASTSVSRTFRKSRHDSALGNSQNLGHAARDDHRPSREPTEPDCLTPPGFCCV